MTIQFAHAEAALAAASVSTLGASFADWATDESGSTQTINYSATNELNQYEVIQRPNPLLRLVQGFAHPDATVEITLSGGEAGETVSQSLRWGPGLAAFAAQAAVTLNAQAGWRRVYIKASRPGLGAGGETVSITRDGWLFFPPVNETLSYDLDGNLTADARWTYGWDGDNRLIWMEEKPIIGTGPRPPRQRLEYAYDSQSRRIAKRVLRKTHELGDWSLHQHRQFLYDGWNMIGELDVPTPGGTARLHRSYAWGLDASGTLTGAGGVGGLLLTTHYAIPGSGTSSNVTLAPLYDFNSNVLAYADVTTSTITHRIDYDPFGNELTLDTLLPTAATEEAPRFRFSTKYTDSESGLVYYGFRSYSPELGRWVNRDPIEERGGVNLYGMVGNDPVNRWDLLGMIATTPSGGGDPCCELIELIRQLIEELKKRAQDMLQDSNDLFFKELAGFPTSGRGGTWSGHIEQIEGKRTQLIRAINDYIDNRCPPDPVLAVATVLALQPSPDRPSGYPLTGNPCGRGTCTGGYGTGSNDPLTQQILPYMENVPMVGLLAFLAIAAALEVPVAASVCACGTLAPAL